MTKAGKSKALAFGLLLAAFLAASLLFTARPAHAKTFTVDAAADLSDPNLEDGACVVSIFGGCTLRAAIEQANASAGADTINFNIPGGGVRTITPNTPLPDITGPVTINGYSQPGASANTKATGNDAKLLVELNGTNAGPSADGLFINASNVVVRGLAINRFGSDAISLFGGDGGHVVEGNFIGAGPSGNGSQGNGGSGVRTDSANANIVGGTTPAARNVISANHGSGVFINSDTNLVWGNYIGANASGTLARPNNGGVNIRHGTNNFVGGATTAVRNVISGNSGHGVMFDNGTAGGQLRDNFVRGNYIGTDATGKEPLGNSGNGVLLDGFCGTVRDHTVGGTNRERNIIAFNSSAGVVVAARPCDNPSFGSSAFGNAILSNSIFSNGLLGIDLGGDGRTSNDPGDADTGPNDLQNFPVLNSAKTGKKATTVKGTLNSTPNKTFTVRFFSGSSGEDEGKQFIGQTSVTTNESGDASFTFTPSRAVLVGQAVTATTTAPGGNTSEFSTPIRVVKA